MFKYLVNKFNNNGLVILLFISIFSSYNTPFLFLVDFNQLNFFKIFIIYQYISPLIIFIFLTFYVCKYNFFNNLFSKNNLTLKFLVFLNFILIFGIFFNNLNYFYPVDELTSQISGKVLLDWKSNYTRLIFVINNFNIIFFSFVCFKEERLKFILSFIMLVLSIISFYYILLILYDYIIYQNVIYFYESNKLRLGASTFSFVNPRSSGLARTILFISLFLLIFFLFFKSKNNFYNKFLKLFIIFSIIFLNFFIIQLESRVSVYFLYLFMLSAILFNFFYKLYEMRKLYIFIFIFFFLPLFLSVVFTEYKKNKIYDHIIQDSLSKNVIIKKNDFKALVQSRLLDVKNTSGRKDIWIKVIKSYNQIPVLGYGVLGDRFAYSFSVSNIFLYFFISGGILGLFTIVIFNVYLLKNFLILLISKKLIYKSDPFFYISVIFIIFILFRSLVENSYGQFNIDLMIFVPCCLFLEKELKRHKIIS
jgi:hypothetical protein